MAEAAKRVAFKTTLVIEGLEIAVGAFATMDRPGALESFETAGPHGGVLRAELRAQATPVADVPQGDAPAPLMDPLADAPVDAPAPPRAPAGEMVPGEFGRVLVEDGYPDVDVTPEMVRRGVRLEDGSFVDCTAQLAAIEERTKLETADVVGFIDVGQVPRERVVGTYYIGAVDELGPKRLRALYHALRSRRRAAVLKTTKRSRQTLGVIVAHAPSETLMLLELMWAEDFREAPARALAWKQAQVSERELSAMCELVDAMHERRVALDELRDDALVLREDLRELALSGAVAEVVQPPVEIPQEQDFEALLEASLAAVHAERD